MNALSSPRSPYEEVAHEYFSYNPALFDDPSIAYRQLQKLSMKLGLGGAGKRADVTERLQQWHRRYLIRDKNSPMKNFALVEVNVDKAGKKNRAVSPRLLSPLKKRPSKRRADGTPVSILSPGRNNIVPPEKKQANMYSNSRAYAKWLEQTKAEEMSDKENQQPNEVENQSDENENEEATKSTKKKRRISFSCINGVKLIPVRPPTPEVCYWRQENLPEVEEEEEEGSPRECNEYFESDDQDSEEEEQEQEEEEQEQEEDGVKNLNNSFEGAESGEEEAEQAEQGLTREEKAKQRKKRRCSLDQLRAPSRAGSSAIDMDEELDDMEHIYDDDEVEEGEVSEESPPRASPVSSIRMSLSPGAMAVAGVATTILASVISVMAS